MQKINTKSYKSLENIDFLELSCYNKASQHGTCG